MRCCFGSRTSAAQTKEIAELEEQQEQLEDTIKTLEAELEQDEAAKRRADEELQCETVVARAAQADMEAKEWERNQLVEELEEATQRRRRVSFNEVVENDGRGVIPGEGPSVIPSPSREQSEAARQTKLKQAWSEAESLMREISDLHVELDEGRHRYGMGAIQTAEAAASQLREELAEGHRRLSVAKEENTQLEAECRTLEKEEEPLQEWVEHVSREIQNARTENAELSKSLIALSAQRADLQRDELEAVPRGTIENTLQVKWLQEQECKNAETKEALLEEIAAQRLRREQFLEEAAARREELQVQSPGEVQVASPQRAQAIGKVQGGDIKKPQQKTVVQKQTRPHIPSIPVAAEFVETPGSKAQRVPMRDGRAAQIISPNRYQPRRSAPEEPLPRVTLEQQMRENAPLLSSPTMVEKLLANSAGERAEGFKMPTLPDAYSSGDEDVSGNLSSYWTGLAAEDCT